MIRWLLLLLGGALLGGIVHLATVIILPRTATQDAYARLERIAPVNKVVPLPASTPDSATMPFMDPAFASAVCRYDLSQGPLKLTVPVSLSYTSVSFYTRNDIAYYAINDRAAGRRVIELDLMTLEQHNQLPEEEDVTADDRHHRHPRAGAGAGPAGQGAKLHRRGAMPAVRRREAGAVEGHTRQSSPAKVEEPVLCVQSAPYRCNLPTASTIKSMKTRTRLGKWVRVG
jgi:uncharacterized membrane protein